VKRVTDSKLLDHYVLKYDINNIFSTDMKKYMELILFDKNEHICKTDEKLNCLFFFVEGKAKVYTTLSNGKSLLLCFYRPFKIIGDVEVIELETANSNIQAVEPTYCISIAFENLRKVALEDPKFLRFLCSSLGGKLISLSKYSSINLLYPLENRLASYILATTSGVENEACNNIIFDGNLSEVSELLGTSYRHLLRTLNTLCKRGAIKKNEQHYEILNTTILDELAGELYE
jgi:CRP-like cAMP-binding protein